MPTKPGRPQSGVLPLSANRMPVLLTPEAQQVLNEVMKTEGITDRSSMMDKIVKEWGEKQKGLKPAMIKRGKIIDTGDSEQSITEFAKDKGDSPQQAMTSQDITAWKSNQLMQMQIENEMKKLDKSMSSEGGFNMDKVMQYRMYESMMNPVEEQDTNPMKSMLNSITPFLGMKMTMKMIGTEEDGSNKVLNEIKELFRQQQHTNGPSQEVQELKRRLDQQETDKRYEALVRMVKESGGSQKDMLQMMTTLKSMDDKPNERAEASRIQHQDTLNKMHEESSRTQQNEITRLRQNDQSGLSKMIKEKAESMTTDIITKGFSAAKDEGSMTKDIISSVFDKINEPIIKPLITAAASKMQNPQQPQTITREQWEQLPSEQQSQFSSNEADMPQLPPENPQNLGQPQNPKPSSLNSYVPGDSA